MNAENNSNEVSATQVPAVAQSTALSTDTANRQGFESPSSQDDFEIPRAKLFHGLPTEYEDYPDAKPGMILNNITKEALPSVFIPIFRHIEWIRFNPRDSKDPAFDMNHDAGAVIWRSSNPSDPRVVKEGAFGPNGEVPIATKFLSFLSYFPGVNMPVIVSFSKTSFKAGKQLNTMLTFNTGDMWASKFTLASKLTKSGQNAYYVYEVKGAGKSDENEMAICQNLYDQFKAKPISAEADKSFE